MGYLGQGPRQGLETLLARALAGADMVAATAWHFLIGGALLAGHGGRSRPGPAINWTSRFTVVLVFLSLVATAAAFLAWFREAAHSRLDLLTAWTLVVPIIGMGASLLLPAEQPPPTAAAGAGTDRGAGGTAMMYWGGDMGGWGYVLMIVSFVLFWGAIITGLVLLAHSTGAGGRRYEGGVPGHGVAEDRLAERFARGEIDETEYNSRLTALRRGRSAPR